MPIVNMGKVESSGFPLLTPGSYLAKPVKVTPTHAKNGSEMWEIELAMIQGPEGAPDPHAEGKSVWDRITWSQAGLPRCKLVLSAIGFDVSTDQDVDWQPSVLLNRLVRVDVINAEFNGRKKNEVPFAGWHSAEGGGHAADAASPGAQDDIPF